jgi:hypothetical protein
MKTTKNTQQDQFIVNEFNFSGETRLSFFAILTNVKIDKGGGGGQTLLS